MGMIFNFLRVTEAELNDYLKDSSLLEERVFEPESEDEYLADIDKSWEGILFLLTGNNLENLNHPMGRVLFSNRVIDEDQDLGYGPASYLTADEVKEINAEIANITTADLKKKFDPVRMTELEVYPNVWKDKEVFDEYLAAYFKTIQEIYSEASQNNQAIITFIN